MIKDFEDLFFKLDGLDVDDIYSEDFVKQCKNMIIGKGKKHDSVKIYSAIFNTILEFRKILRESQIEEFFKHKYMSGRYQIIADYLYLYWEAHPKKNLCIVAPPSFGKTPVVNYLEKEAKRLFPEIKRFQHFPDKRIIQRYIDADIPIVMELVPCWYERNKDYFDRKLWHIIQFN